MYTVVGIIVDMFEFFRNRNGLYSTFDKTIGPNVENRVLETPKIRIEIQEA